MLRIKGHTFIRIKGHTSCGLRVTLLFGSRDSFNIRIRQRILLLFESDNRFLYYSSPTKDSFTIRVRQKILYYSSRTGFLYYYSLKGFLYYSGPTRDSVLFLSQRIPLLFGSDNRFLYYSSPTRDSCTIRVRQKGPSPRRTRAKSRQLLFIGTRWHNKH